MAHASEDGAYQKIMKALSGTPQAPQGSEAAPVRKGAATVTMGSTCTPAGQKGFAGSTPCATPAKKKPKPKAAPSMMQGILSSMGMGG